jgi:hypothetical protein
MSLYIDLLITNNDLTLDPSNQPVLVDDRASIAQDIAHMIRESGLLVTLMAERDRFRRTDCIKQLELLVEEDERLVPGTVEITETGSGQYRVAAKTVAFGAVEVAL